MTDEPPEQGASVLTTPSLSCRRCRASLPYFALTEGLCIGCAKELAYLANFARFGGRRLVRSKNLVRDNQGKWKNPLDFSKKEPYVAREAREKRGGGQEGG